MTREEMIGLEKRLIERGERDFKALGDAFELARNAEDHENTEEIRRLARKHLRENGQDALDLYFKTHLFDAVDSFDSYLIYTEKKRCLRMMDPDGDYLWHDVFPDLGVISTNAKDMLIDVGHSKKDGKRFTTLEFSSIGSGNAGKENDDQRKEGR